MIKIKQNVMKKIKNIFKRVKPKQSFKIIGTTENEIELFRNDLN